MKKQIIVAMMFLFLCYAAETDVLFNIMSNRYSFASWCGTTSQPYNRILSDWTIPDFYFATNGLPVSCERYGDAHSPHYSLEWNGASVLLIDAVVATNVVSAQEKMLKFFTRMATAPVFERVSTAGIGDVYYEYPGTNSWCSAIFSRNNICVWVNSFTNSLNARTISRQIDADILQRSTTVNP